MRHHSAFSLMELIVAMVVLGIITAIAVPSFTVEYRRGEEGKVVTDVTGIASTMRSHSPDCGSAPTLAKNEVGFAGITNIVCVGIENPSVATVKTSADSITVTGDGTKPTNGAVQTLTGTSTKLDGCIYEFDIGTAKGTWTGKCADD